VYSFLLMNILHRAALVLVAAMAAASCKTAGSAGSPQTQPAPILQPGAPGEASRVIGVAQATDLSKVGATPADIKFMQGMIGHHAQAVEMVALIPSRTQNEDMKKLGMRIDVSQQDEIKMMREWLTARGAAVPDAHAHHTPGGMMPGMLTPEEMTALAAAKGTEFDRLFLEGMIKHHQGAITMVEELFNSPRAGQESDINAFAADVDADQRMEIGRMGAMLNAIKEKK
jgi:uncharacterized protein (DUF305 family)